MTAFSFLFLLPAAADAQAPATGVRTLPAVQYQKVAVVDMSTVQDDWNPLLKTVRTIHQPGVNPEKDEFLRQKAAANAKLKALQASGTTAPAMKTTAGSPPTKVTGFPGNAHQNDPADNAMAISAEGLILSSVNSNIYVYDSAGAQLSAKSLIAFAQGANINFFVFDPKIVYDPVADRYVVVFLAGSNSSNSSVVVGFSQSNNPSGLYNIYTINGNFNNEGTWTDFPQIGLSTDELFITGNRFSNDGNSSPGAAVWQVDKAAGYSGASSLTVVPHAADGQFSLHPVEGGLNLYGPHFYLIRSGTGAGNSVSLYRITNNIANNGILEPPLTLTLNNSYTVAPDANQSGTSVILRTNDVRVQSSYFENDRIEFTLNSSVNGLPGIMHGTIEVSSFILSFSSASAELVSYPDYHISYPAIAYAGTTSTNGDNHSVISFNFAGPNHRPGCAALWLDENGYSPLVELRAGINPIFAGQNRWGDYTDSQERPGHPGEIWVAGSFGNSSSDQRTYLAQVGAPVPVANESSIFEDAADELEAWPSPANTRINFEFPVETEGEYQLVIRDIQGREIKRLVKNWLRVGEARVAFDTDALPAGMYLVSVENENLRVFSKQFAVQH